MEVIIESLDNVFIEITQKVKVTNKYCDEFLHEGLFYQRGPQIRRSVSVS